MLLCSDNSVNIFRHPTAQTTVYLAYDIGVHYQSAIRTVPSLTNHQLQPLIAQTPAGEWRLYSEPLLSRSLPRPSSAPLPLKLRPEKRKDRQLPATTSKIIPKLTRPLTTSSELESPYIPHLTKLTDYQKDIFEKLPWRFSGKKVHPNQHHMGVDHGDAVVRKLREMRRISLELFFAHLLSQIFCKPFKEEWSVIELILDYAESVNENYLRSSVLGELKMEEPAPTLNTQVGKSSRNLNLILCIIS